MEYFRVGRVYLSVWIRFSDWKLFRSGRFVESSWLMLFHCWAGLPSCDDA